MHLYRKVGFEGMAFYTPNGLAYSAYICKKAI